MLQNTEGKSNLIGSVPSNFLWGAIKQRTPLLLREV